MWQKIKKWFKRLGDDVAQPMLDTEIIEIKISKFKGSKERAEMIKGEEYHNGTHDILKRKRQVIGEGGALETVDNLPNNRIVDNQYGKMVDQKKNYMLGQPFIVRSENKTYSKLLKQIFDRKFHRLLKNVGEDALNMGLGWVFIYYNEQGELSFKRIKAYEMIPVWKDSEHTELDYAIRVYETAIYKNDHEETIEKVEVYKPDGIYRFILDGNKLTADTEPYSSYLTIDEVRDFNWSKIPLIPFRYNSKEIPLIRKVKSLQDGLNLILSNFQNNMEEDARNTILVLINYDNTELGKFRQNLAQYGVVKVTSLDGVAGGVETLQIEVNAENYKLILELFKKAIMENAKGYDAKDDRMRGSPNQMNILSMYSDIDLDANEMETEFQASFIDLMWFVDAHLANAGAGNYDSEEVTVIFNRDIMISEGEVIDNIQKSMGILSEETLIDQHPWVDDPVAELARIAKQRESEKQQIDQFNQVMPNDQET